MTLLRKYYSPGIEGGGIPDEVIKMLEEKFRLPTEKELGDFESIEDAVSHMATQNLCFAMSKYGYSLASEELSRLKEENERLRGEVERTAKYGIDVLQENHQAQIAGYYNHDKTDTEREKRNAVIEEYADLIGIFKANLTPSPTKKQ